MGGTVKSKGSGRPLLGGVYQPSRSISPRLRSGRFGQIYLPQGICQYHIT